MSPSIYFFCQTAKRSVTVGNHEEARPFLEGVARRYQTLGLSPMKVTMRAYWFLYQMGNYALKVLTPGNVGTSGIFFLNQAKSSCYTFWVGFVCLLTSSLWTDRKPCIHPPPSQIQIVFTDNCDTDRPFLQEVFQAAAVADPGEVTSAPAVVDASPLLHLAFPGDTRPIVIVVKKESCPHSSFACTHLLDLARISARSLPGQQVLLGFDCEWTPSLRGRGKVAVVQLSSLCGYTVLFHVKTHRGSEAGVMPTALKELMENDRVQLVRTAMNGLQNSRTCYIQYRYCAKPPPVVRRP